MIRNLPTKHPNNQEKIAYWEDFLLNEEIELLLNQPEWKEMRAGMVGGQGEGEFNLKSRSSMVCWVEDKKELDVLWKKIGNTVAEVNRRFFQFELDAFYEPMQLSLYCSDFNGHYDWHVDSSKGYGDAPRKLSMALMLSDPRNFEGGNLEVKSESDEAIVLEQKKGRAWFFPSYTLHRVSPVTKGERKSAVLWVGGPPFR